MMLTEYPDCKFQLAVPLSRRDAGYYRRLGPYIMQKQANILVVWILINVIDAIGIEGGGTSDNTVDFIPVLQ